MCNVLQALQQIRTQNLTEHQYVHFQFEFLQEKWSLLLSWKF